MDEYRRWMDSPALSEQEWAELNAIAEDEKEIRERFYAPLEFGTAGLRGTMKTGLHNMNIHIIRHATQAFADVISAEGETAKKKGIVIAHDCRLNGRQFAEEAAAVMAANGIYVRIFDALRPTPELSFAVRYYGATAGLNVMGFDRNNWAAGGKQGLFEVDCLNSPAYTLRLEYDGWYFATHGKQLRFLRHKTRERNEDASEVIFPITPEIKKILDKYANEPKQGQRVFPIMSQGITPDKEIWVIQRYNKYIRKHMEIVAKLLGLEQLPTPTWARHSFATNLNNSGRVPYKYISDSMGHSSSGDITSNYIGTYPLEKMLEYNAYLLVENGRKSSSAMLLEQFKGLSATEQKKILDALSKSIK